MKLDGKQIAEFAGMIAVVLSLLFVAFELRLSNTIADRESRAAITDKWFELSSAIYENPEVASLFAKLKDPSPTLTPEEEVKALAVARTYTSLIGLINSGYDAGTLPEDILQVHLSAFENIFQENPGLIPYFQPALGNRVLRRDPDSVFNRVFAIMEQK